MSKATVKIKNLTGEVLFASTTAGSVRQAVVEAVSRKVNLRYAELTGVDLSGLVLDDSRFEGAHLGPKLSGTSFKNATLYEAEMNDSHVVNANFEGADLTRVTFEKSDLTGATLPDGYEKMDIAFDDAVGIKSPAS